MYVISNDIHFQLLLNMLIGMIIIVNYFRQIAKLIELNYPPLLVETYLRLVGAKL